MMSLYLKFRQSVSNLSDLPPLFFRLILSYGFYEPAMKKLNNFEAIAQWFGSLGMPFPTVNAFMATATETSGFILLFLGLGTRIISIPLIVVMIVAIVTVHLPNGFSAGNNGYEIPLYYMLMLISLIITGPGKFSLDAIIEKKYSDR